MIICIEPIPNNYEAFPCRNIINYTINYNLLQNVHQGIGFTVKLQRTAGQKSAERK